MAKVKEIEIVFTKSFTHSRLGNVYEGKRVKEPAERAQQFIDDGLAEAYDADAKPKKAAKEPAETTKGGNKVGAPINTKGEQVTEGGKPVTGQAADGKAAGTATKTN